MCNSRLAIRICLNLHSECDLFFFLSQPICELDCCLWNLPVFIQNRRVFHVSSTSTHKHDLKVARQFMTCLENVGGVF